MIARGVPIGTVCLGCRLRLLRQLTPIRYVTNHAANTPRPDDFTGDRADGDDAARDVDQEKRSKPKSRLRSGMRRLNLRKRHVSGNRVLDETAVSLGSDMLGKPAYAIIMRDGGKVRRREIPLVTGEDEVEPESTQNLAATIEALLDSRREPLTLQEMRSSIHDLRPKTDKVLSEKDFRKLVQLLTDGFLTAQLQDYVEWLRSDAGRESRDAVNNSSSIPDFPWILERSPWAPLRTEPNAVVVTDPALQGYISPTTTPKEILALHLMRESWGLSIAELETQLGEIRVKFHSAEFVLLMRATQRFMNTLGKIWLEPGEKIEAFRNQKTLRLVATKPKAELLLRDLDETLKSVRIKKLPVRLLASEAPDDAILEELGRITNSHIRKIFKGKILEITWIDVKSRATSGPIAVENMAHIVFRLLLTASAPQQATTTTLLSPIVPQEHSGRLIVDVTNKDKLAWKDRLAQWARFVHPVTPEEESLANPTLPIKKFELPFEPMERIETPEEIESLEEPKPLEGTEPLDKTELFEETESGEDTKPLEKTESLEETEPPKKSLKLSPKTKIPSSPVKWSNVSQTSTVASFGQVLHPYQSSNPTPLLSDLLASTDRRIFAPTAPHPLHLSKIGASDPDSTSSLQATTKVTLVLRFWPSATQSSKKLESDATGAPILELRLAASDREIQGVESLRAITRTHHTDVMLPSSPVDVRFTQTQYETLQGRDAEALAKWRPLLDFLKHSHLDLENGKIEVLPHQRFSLPRRMLADSTTSHHPTQEGKEESTAELAEAEAEQQQQNETQSDDSVDNVRVHYEFVGLEFHRSVTLPYEGHQLTYTSIEAGQGGGRRAEVTLEPVQPLRSITPATETVDKGTLQENFLGCCSRFVADRSLWSGIGDLTH
ncbi:mitochondrial inner-membrane-bound regulator-domain-containing protein [Xylaria flabelliformis]|nr:mitochondrial inner-membrane-bound regulator-domain-containing protein [Xylaria flabelliformis]